MQEFLKLRRKVHWLISDFGDYLLRTIRGKQYLPPRRLRRLTGTESILLFEAAAKKYMTYFKDLCSLKANENILDIGCGCGKIALPLTKFLKHGHYCGMDITKESVEWCQRNISRKYPQFRFYHADIKNKAYNPKGRYSAENYSFPFQNRSFDFIFLASVFTHILPKQVDNYLEEIARLLKNEGRVLISFFLLNNEQKQLAEKGLNALDFKFNYGVYRTTDKNIPERAIAYDENYIRNMMMRKGFKIGRIKYGSWSGRHKEETSKPFKYTQDIVIAYLTQNL